MNDQLGKNFKYEESFIVPLRKREVPFDPKIEAIKIKEDLEWFESQYHDYSLRRGSNCLPCIVYGSIIKGLKRQQYTLAKVL